VLRRAVICGISLASAVWPLHVQLPRRTMKELIDLFLHLQDHLMEFTRAHGALVYALLFAVVFCETGLVVTPFLPGDSLLFAIGAIAADPASGLNVWYSALVLYAAAFLGDNTNYWIGRACGNWLLRRFPGMVKREHLEKTHAFFERYGGKTIIIARFVPIVRTITPFVAGTGRMSYRRFISYSLVASTLWIGLIVPAGWFFGNIPVVKEHFEMVVLGIIGISLLPMVFEAVKHRAGRKSG
jgi:membrane-associated protein